MNLNKILFWLLLSLLVWLPLPYGSKPQWASGILVLLVCALSAAWLVGFAFNKVSLTRAFRDARWLHVGFIVFCGWVWFQQLPLPQEWVAFLSPQAWSIQTDMYEALGASLPASMTLSVDPFSTQLTGLLTLAYYLLFCLTLLLVNDNHKLQCFAWAFVVSGTFQAVFGALSTLSGLEILLFSPKETYFGVATGTYVNRNSFAGGLEITLAMGMGLLIAQLSDKKAGSWSEWFRTALQTLMSNKVILRTSLAVMVIGLVLSRSRMGNTAFFSSLMLTGLLYVICRKKLTRGMVILFVSLLLIDTVIVSQWFGLEQVVNRIEQTSLERETRPNVAEMTIEGIKEYVLTGSGGGSFYTTLPQYHDGSWRGFYDLAHNDFLQFLLEFGLPAYLILVFMVLTCGRHATQALRQRRSKLMIGMAFSAFMGMLAIMIHSSVDFNLQIPANAAYFVCLMALAVIARYAPHKPV
ncbi:hypothetical protein ACH42_07315 [Endozoicomonas sp. (ex Bugula neritina AB1)]|nr:hypothetical protein ACH42_07315 [Endozoicomonas sp. (ex Bugula neritina AB1)]